MTLLLAVETSSVFYGVALADGPRVLAERTRRRDEPDFSNVGAAAAELLRSAGVEFAQLGRLAVDVGPGSLGSVRAGVAFVNGLAFSLGLDIVAADSLALTAAAVADGEPVLCVRRGAAGNVFAALHTVDGKVRRRFGPPADVVPALAAGHPSLAVAGALREEVAALLAPARVKDTGVENPEVRVLALGLGTVADAAVVAVATPVTEESAIFHG